MTTQKEKKIKWKLPKKRQPIWKIFKFVLAPFFHVKNVEFLGEKFPKKCIIVSNHNNKKGPIVYEFSLPTFHATWGAYPMLGSYKMRFEYLRNIFYMQKNGVGKFKATLRAGFESIFSIFAYKGIKVIPSYPDARFRKTLEYSMDCLDNDICVSVYPEDSDNGYFDEMTHFFPGFVMLADMYFKKTGEDVPVFPAYYGRKKKKIVIGKPISVQDLVKQGLNREEIAEVFRLEVNKLYQEHFKE